MWVQEGMGESANIIIPELGLQTVASDSELGKYCELLQRAGSPQPIELMGCGQHRLSSVKKEVI